MKNSVASVPNFPNNFCLGNTFISPGNRPVVWEIYTWCRRTDYILHGTCDKQRSSERHIALQIWEVWFNATVKGNTSEALVLEVVDAN